jgi:hypothetical protein
MAKTLFDSSTPPPNHVGWEDTRGIPLPKLSDLEQFLCRIRNRRYRFGGNQEAVAALGYAAMVGLVVGETRDYVKSVKQVRGIPTNAVLAKFVGETAGAVGDFLRGQQRQPKWANHGRSMMRYLLGGTGPVDPNARTIVDRIDHFFFRDFEPKIGPALFRKERYRFADPFTRTELAGEIRWFARQAAIHESSRLVLVSGGEQLPVMDPIEKELGLAICDVLRTKARVEFVLSPNSKQSPDLAKEFEAAFNYSMPKQRIKKPDVPEMLSGFLNPVLQFLYHETHFEGHPEKTLYIVRRVTDYSELREMPLALEGTATELHAFQHWLQKVDSQD